jgi:hypothetical protein
MNRGLLPISVRAVKDLPLRRSGVIFDHLKLLELIVASLLESMGLTVRLKFMINLHFVS